MTIAGGPFLICDLCGHRWVWFPELLGGPGCETLGRHAQIWGYAEPYPPTSSMRLLVAPSPEDAESDAARILPDFSVWHAPWLPDEVAHAHPRGGLMLSTSESSLWIARALRMWKLSVSGSPSTTASCAPHICVAVPGLLALCLSLAPSQLFCCHAALCPDVKDYHWGSEAHLTPMVVRGHLRDRPHQQSHMRLRRPKWPPWPRQLRQ